MAMLRNGGARSIPLGLQIANMAVQFPGFRFNHQAMSWFGYLQPTPDSPHYRIRIGYRPPCSPRVWVRDPLIHPDAKHRYDDGTLCLYDPRVGDWHPGLFLSETIASWAAEWLLYYEAWLVDPQKRWFGPEAPHGPLKRPAR